MELLVFIGFLLLWRWSHVAVEDIEITYEKLKALDEKLETIALALAENQKKIYVETREKNGKETGKETGKEKENGKSDN